MKKSFNEHLNTKASAFGNQTLEGHGDAFSKQEISRSK
jgi:hypothetical protein